MEKDLGQLRKITKKAPARRPELVFLKK